MLNNPLKYTDPSGDFPIAAITTIIASAIISGTTNAMINVAISAFTNTMVTPKQLMGDFAVGAATGMVSAGLSSAFFPAGIVKGAIINATINTTTNVVGKMLHNAFTYKDIFEGVGEAALRGAISGAVAGAVNGYLLARWNGLNYFWGTPPDKWAHNRGQWSFAWWNKPDKTYKFPIKNVSAYIDDGCTYASLKAISKSYNIKGKNQLYWEKSFRVYSKSKTSRPTDLNFEDWLLSEGFYIEDVTYDMIPESFKQNKRIGAWVTLEDGSFHMLVLKKANFYPENDFNLIFMDPNGGGRFILNQENIKNYSPKIFEIYR